MTGQNAALLRYTCLHCLQPDGAELRVDKKGRPWTWCSHCRTRSFIHNAAGLRGIRLVAPLLVQHYQKVMATLGQVDSESEAHFDQLQQQQERKVSYG